MKKALLCKILSLVVSASLLVVPGPAAFAEDRRVTTGKILPPGIPVPGVNIPIPVPGVNIPVPVPVPAPPVVIERERHPQVVVHRDRDRDRGRDDDRGRGRGRDDDRDWDRGDRLKHRDKWSHKHRHGRVYRTLPADVFTLSIGGGTFFYHFGTYYRHSGDGYVVVEAPVGARVRILPDHCSTFYVDGLRYYECSDVYYESLGNEYIVIDGPPRGYRLPEAAIGEEVWIRADTLNIRSGPGRSYRVIGQLYRGEVVEVSGKERGWYYIRQPGGSYGWITKEHARLYRHRLD